MKRLIQLVQKQAIFFPACRSCLVHRSPTTPNLLRRLYIGVGGSVGRLHPFLFLLLPLSFFLITACPDPPKDNTPERDTTINLEVLSTFTTTAKLRISVDDTTAEWAFGLTRNGEDVLTATVLNMDTTFTDFGLNPGTQYTYQAQWLEDGIAVDSSLAVIAQTMDTTSHNFVWEVDTLGNYGSYLKDVAIIDENNIWVVGNIETDTATYNAAHWDGSEWELIKIKPQGYVQPINVIWFIADNDIWFGQSTLPIHWDGETFYLFTPADDDYPGGSIINSIWGSSPYNIYFVGNGGGIVHYDGSAFIRMESGTDVDLKDIYGINNNDEGISIWTCGYSADYSKGSLLKFQNGQWLSIVNGTENIFGAQYGNLFSSIWPDSKNTIYVSLFSSIFNLNTLNLEFIKLLTIPYVGFYKIRGINSNDIFIAGEYGNVWHYNGNTWYKYLTMANDNTYYFSIDFTDNQVCAVGYVDISSYQSHAVICRGVRLD